MINKGTKVKIDWNDIRVFSPKRREISLSKMETVGLVEKDHEDYLVVKDPLTINILTKKKHPEKNPTFYFIPKVLILKVEEVV